MRQEPRMEGSHCALTMSWPREHCRVDSGERLAIAALSGAAHLEPYQ